MTPLVDQPSRPQAHPADPAEVERIEYAFYRKYVRDGMVVFDVGANVGLLTALFAECVGQRGSVHAFEPEGRAFARLASRLDPGEGNNVRLLRSALADRTGTATLHVYDDDHLTWNTFANRPLQQYGIDVSPVGREQVQVTTIDEYCARQGVSHIDLLKIDVEGAELQVLLGAHGMLQEKRVGCCAFEFGQTTLDMGNSPRQIQDYLSAVGYSVRNIVDGDPLFPEQGQPPLACFSMHLAQPVN